MKIVCWPFLFLALFLSACAPGSKDEPASVAAVTTTYSPPKPTVSQEGTYTVVHGATSVQDMVTQYDSSKRGLLLRGKINVRPIDGANPFVVEVDLEGLSDRDGFVVMKGSANQPSLPPDVKLGVKATCLGKDNECTSSFIDIYIQYRDKVYHHQVESHETAAATSEEPVIEKKPLPATKPETPVQKPADAKPAAPVAPITPSAPVSPSAPVTTPKEETKPVAKPEVKPEPKKTEPKDDTKPAAKPDVKPVAKTETKPVANPAAKPEPKSEAKPAAKPVPKTEVKKPAPKPEELPDGEDEAGEGEDDEANGRYIGDIQGDIALLIDGKVDSKKMNSLFNQDQVVSPSKTLKEGRLEHATNLLIYEKTHSPAGFHVINPKRERYYGSVELVYMIAKLGAFTKKLIPHYVLAIGDLSKKNGGSLGTHASHQNGLDADIGFFFKDAKIQGNLFSALQAGKAGKPITSWMPEEQWKLLRHAVSTHYVDRIFIHPTLKATLCQIAIKNGEITESQKDGDAFELLRRLRPEKNHYNHFHLRVKCSKAQVRCRQMADPAPTTGCFS